MKEIAFFAELCYSRKHRMKEYVKIGLFCSLFVICAAGFVVATTLGVIHYNNTKGQGGLETPGLPELTVNILNEEEPAGLQLAESAGEPEQPADSPLYYTAYCIKSGDMISRIAEAYNVTQDTILSVNNIHASRSIQPGQYLKIPSMPGILYSVKKDGETLNSIAEKYNVDVQKCALANNVATTDELAAGRTIFVPDAEMDWATKQEINGDLFTKPVHRSYYISSRYGWRTSPFDSSRRTFHGGLDMACPRGTTIYAALAGTVSATGWSDVYGNYVIITHHSGYKTLYGHMSKITTVKGAKVGTNSKIGEVGSTGQSTGPHLHFTVYKNNKSMDPQLLLK